MVKEGTSMKDNSDKAFNIWLISSLYKKIVKHDHRPWSCVFGWHHFQIDMSTIAHTGDCIEPDCDSWDWG